MPEHSRHSSAAQAGRWAVMVLAFVLAVIGIAMLGGGIYLIVLGGSWYYALAGLLLIVSAGFLFRLDRMGAMVYVALWVLTLLWTIWEVGFEWWAWVPRMVAPSVLLVLVLLSLPALSQRRSTAAQTA